jgi:hypothetical protein
MPDSSTISVDLLNQSRSPLDTSTASSSSFLPPDSLRNTLDLPSFSDRSSFMSTAQPEGLTPLRDFDLPANFTSGYFTVGSTGHVGSNGFIKQTFKHGYIIWNGSKAIAYRNGNGVSIPSVPLPSNPETSVPPLHPNPTSANPLRGFRHPLMGAGSVTQGANGSMSHYGRSQYPLIMVYRLEHQFMQCVLVRS